MASVTNELFCCDDCACSIANGDTSGLDYYGPEYRAKWEAGVRETTKHFGYRDYPVISCPEDCSGGDKQEFNCDWCSRNVYSHKFNLSILTD